VQAGRELKPSEWHNAMATLPKGAVVLDGVKCEVDALGGIPISRVF